MAFSDFKTVEQVIQKYPLKIKRKKFLPDVKTELSELFMENLTFSLETQAENESEAFFCESFIFPFLHQVWKSHRKLKVWSHKSLRYDDELYGEPDYFVAVSHEDKVIDRFVTMPVLAVAEAKKQDFEGGWAQCLAEMVACQKINENENITIYGIVSTGIIWEFG
ncbi:MAG: hypothetical protein GY749_09945, partial [Desulfobacteraceae bacterium]|nr:hypothetical protein [Desulfobacteraceae bacterium]